MERDQRDAQYTEQLHEGGISPTSPLGMALRDINDRLLRLEDNVLAQTPEPEIGLP